ncbi:MAG: SDR family oxidoreductase [Bacilli bacterium]|nr:SDR family oxidoreductase [Bacilli bacterium]
MIMLDKKVVIVTGGTRGIGYSIVKKFLENKAEVILFGSREESVNKAVASLKEEGYEVMGLYPNLSSLEEVKVAFEKVVEKYGKLDVLINNAGVSSSMPFDKYTEDEYNKLVDLNIKAVYNCSKVAVEYMKENGGAILNTSSMVSIYGQPSGVMYPASKYAVNGMTKSLARELGKYNIRVNAVAPGITETDMVKNLPKEIIEPLIKTIPLGRVGKPEDIANAFLFLASDMASYVTGEILSVDGAAMN